MEGFTCPDLVCFISFSININGKQGVNSLICAYRASNCVYLLVLYYLCVDMHTIILLFRMVMYYIPKLVQRNIIEIGSQNHKKLNILA